MSAEPKNSYCVIAQVTVMDDTAGRFVAGKRLRIPEPGTSSGSGEQKGTCPPRLASSLSEPESGRRPGRPGGRCLRLLLRAVIRNHGVTSSSPNPTSYPWEIKSD